MEDYYHVTGFEHVVARECWDDFQPRVAASTSRLLDILAEADIQATFFVLGWVAEPGNRCCSVEFRTRVTKSAVIATPIALFTPRP